MTQIPIQFDLFKTKEEVEIEQMREHCEKLSKSNEKVRKRLFAENNALNRSMMDLEERLAIIERNICKNG